MTSARKSTTLLMSRYVSIYLKINDISINLQLHYRNGPSIRYTTRGSKVI